MAEMTDALRAEWQRRWAGGDWFTSRYEAALSRIEDHTDGDNPYWLAPADGTSVVPGDSELFDEMGGEESPEDARKRAFEILALADLAETRLARGERQHGD